MKASSRTEVLIIGSGAGGSVTALELADAGMEVMVLEEGGRFGLEDYGESPPQAMKKLYRRRGMTPILGPVSIAYVEGCCLGGSTEINSGFWMRTSAELLEQWKNEFELKDAGIEELAPHFEVAERLVKVSRCRGEWPASTQVLARGLQALGWAGDETPRVAFNCQNTNACASGCPTGAKQGMSRSLIPLAEAKGARIQPGCRVLSLLGQGSKVTGVLAHKTNQGGAGETIQIDAEHVFVCAGPIETATLLRRSGIKQNVGNSFCTHPMLKVVARFNEEMDAEHSALPLIQVKEFWPDMTLGGAFYSPGHLAILLSDNWMENSKFMSYRRHMAAYHVTVKGTGKGYVRASPFKEQTSIIRYNLTREEIDYLSKGLARLCMLLLAGGAVEVYPCVYGLPTIRTEAEARRWLNEQLPSGSLSLSSVHGFSTCPIGERREICAADSFGKVHGFDNLYINDASMLPSSPGANPQASIMAMARRNALHFRDGKK